MQLNREQQKRSDAMRTEREAAVWRGKWMRLKKKYVAGGMSEDVAIITAKKQARLSNERATKGKK